MTVYIIILSVSFFLIYIFMFCTVLCREKKKFRRFSDEAYPKVSVLKPVKNLEDGLEENFRTFFELEYPDFEILFGVDHRSDPVLPLIEGLISEYPGVKAEIVETGNGGYVNPKIHKLAKLEERSSGELYWVADSNIRVDSFTLLKLAGEYIENGTRVVFSPIRGYGARSFGSIVENSFINQQVSGSIIAAWKVLRQQLLVGKSILIEKKTLDIFGGFSYFKSYVGEDYMLGRAYAKSGFPILTNCTWVTSYSSNASTLRFLSRMSRWAKIRFTIRPVFYVFEILSYPIVIAASSLAVLGWRGLPLLAASLVLKLLAEYAILFAVNREDFRKPYVSVGYPFFVICKEILLTVVYFTPFFSRTVKWKDSKMKITRWSVMERK